MYGCKQSVKSALILLCGFLFLCGAISAWAAVENIAVFINPGVDQRENRQMADRMRNDLQNVLERRGGYKVRLLDTAEDFKQDQGEYLLNVRIVRYNSGSKAARIIVGFGAGAASMDIHYEFSDPRGREMLSKEDGVGTSLDWQRLARKLNENILAAIQHCPASGEAAGVEKSVPGKDEPKKPEECPASAQVTQAASEVVAPASSTEPSEQLRKLETLRKEGLITDSEYKQKRQAILDRL
jgi:hypothetical protein